MRLMEDQHPKPEKDFSKTGSAKARDEVRSLLHEFYIEIATTKMSKETFEEFLDRIIDAAAPGEEA